MSIQGIVEKTNPRNRKIGSARRGSGPASRSWRPASFLQVFRAIWELLEDAAYHMSLPNAWFARWGALAIGLYFSYRGVGGLISEDFHVAGSWFSRMPHDKENRIPESSVTLAIGVIFTGFALAGWLYGRGDRDLKR